MKLIRKHNWRPRIAAVAAAAAAFGLIPALTAPAAAASPPDPPVGAFLRSSELTRAQFCAGGEPVATQSTPILGVSKGTPAFNADRPALRARFEVAPLGQSAVVARTVDFVGSLATFQVPAGVLSDGRFRFRVRAEDAGEVSAWLPWCAFTVQTANVVAPGAPGTLRVSAAPYAGFQFCSMGTPVVPAGQDPTFAATPPFGTRRENLVGRFEFERAGQDPLVRVGDLYGVVAPPGSFDVGRHRFRVRAEQGTAVSAWSPWCEFVIEQP